MVLEIIALINDMNKLINDGDVVRDFTLVDKSSIPLKLLALTTRECFTSMKKIDCSKLVTGTELDDTLNKSDSSLLGSIFVCKMNKMND